MYEAIGAGSTPENHDSYFFRFIFNGNMNEYL